jgi:hypothetical protein
MSTFKSYKVGRDGAILGVFDEPEMVYMVSCGKVLGTDDYWTEGMTTWAKVSSRENWSVSHAASSSPPALPPSVNSTVSPRVKPTSVSFFSIWWKTTLVIYVGSACLGYLNSGEYGFGYMLGQGLVTAPLSALLFGGIIYAFSKNSESAATKRADHAKVIREFDRSKVLKK